MSKKKIIMIVAVVLIAVLSVGILAGCNKLKFKGIGGGDANAVVESQGKFVVKQGGYLYYINGYVGENEVNDFGTIIKGSIVRAELDGNGNVKDGTSKVIVPINVYSADTSAAFSIFGDTIYYVAPNTDKDKKGAHSTTHLSVMSSKIDGSDPQLLMRLDARNYSFNFYNGRIVWVESNNLYTADLTKKSTKKVEKSVKEIVSGTSAVRFIFAETYTPGQGENIADYILFTKASESDTDFNNELKAIKYDGSNEHTIVTKETFQTETNKGDDFIYQLSMVNGILEGDSYTLYYTKAYKSGTSSQTAGFFFAKINYAGGKLAIDVASEKKLSESASSTTVTPLGYDKGTFITVNSNLYLVKGYADGSDPYDYPADDAVIVGGSPTVLFVYNDYLYYMSSTTLMRISLADSSPKPRAEAVSTLVSMNSSWIKFERIGSKVYYFDSNEYEYMTCFDLEAENTDDAAAFKPMLENMTEEDKAAWDAREEERKKAEEEEA